MAKKDVKVAPYWLEDPEDHDYPAAADYLSLLFSKEDVDDIVGRLQKAKTTHYKAKDILRSSDLDLLDSKNAHVLKDLYKIATGKKLSPILLVRGDAKHCIPVTVADGYHRVCASYWTDENTDIPCRIVDL